MFRVNIFIFSILALLSLSALGQSLSDNSDYRAMAAQLKEYKAREDSMSGALVATRKLYEEGDTTAANKIVNLEGAIYDLRDKLSRLASRMIAIEQEFASRSLEDHPAVSSGKRGFFANDIFVSTFTPADLARLSSSAKVERTVAEKNNLTTALYGQLRSLKATYETTASQSELDRTRASALVVKNHITKINAELIALWDRLYNFKLDSYLVLMDKMSAIDRTTREALESQGREVRRAEALASELLNANFVVFERQRNYIHTYEKTIARAANLNAALDSIAHLDPILTAVDSMYDLAFDARVLTLYAPVSFEKESYPISKVSEIPEMIVPESGVYYSIQIALMSTEPTSLAMFHSAWPLQVEQTQSGKLRYMVGGFDSYVDASKGLQQLIRAGYRAPVMVSWVDGQFTSPTKARVVEGSRPKVVNEVGSFKIEVRTTDSSVAEKLRAVVEANAKDKSVSRTTSGR
ncbi:MAG: hypothetical protein RR752_03475, partial [Mucinivorans sp.]